MSNVICEKQDLVNIANAIRAKNGKTSEFSIYQMPDEIANISGGGSSGGTSVNTVAQATPTISVSSSGLITASATQSAGYVNAGTKSATKQLTTQSAKTITPSNFSQTAVESGVYTTGTVTVAGVPTETKSVTPSYSQQIVSPSSGKFLSQVTVAGDANLTSGNIRYGATIFGINGSYVGSGGGSFVYPDGAFVPVSNFTDGKQYALVSVIDGVRRYINTTTYNNYTMNATQVSLAEDAGNYVIFSETPALFTAVASGDGFLLQNGTNYLHGTTSSGTALRVGTTQAVWTVDTSEAGGFSDGKYYAKEDTNAVWLFNNSGGYNWSIKFETSGSFGYDRNGRDNTYSTGFVSFVLYEYVAGEDGSSGDVGSGGITLPSLSNAGTASDLLEGKQLIDGAGNIVTGNIPIKTSSDLTVNGATVTVPSGYYASTATKNVNTVAQAAPSVNIDSNGLITASINQSAGYVSGGTESATKQLATQAAKTVTPTTSEQTVVASGVYTTGDVKVSAVSTQTKSVTPTTSAQTVNPDSGKFLSQVSVAAIPSTYVQPSATKGATTYTPSTQTQTIAAGTYCSGIQTIQGDASLIADNIKSGVTIFGVAGTYKGSSSGSGSGGNTTITYPDGAFVPVTSFTDGKQYALVSVIDGAYRYINTTTYNNYTMNATQINIAEDAGDYVVFNSIPVMFTAVASGNGFLLQNGSNYLHGTTSNGTALRVGTTQAVWTVDTSETGGFSSGKYYAKEDANAVWLFNNTDGYDWSIKYETAGSFGFDRNGRDTTYSTGFVPFILYEYAAGSSSSGGGTSSGGNDSGSSNTGISIPDTIVAGDTPVLVSSTMAHTCTATTATATGISITVPRAGTYRFKFSCARTNTSGTWTAQLYKNGTAVSGATATWNQYQGTYDGTVTCAANDKIEIYATSRGTSYRLITGQLVACIDWDTGF